MLYISTRDTSDEPCRITASSAVCRGLAPDGGLYVPEVFPELTADDIKTLCGCDYTARAAFILSRFFDEFSYDEIYGMCAKAYSPERFYGGAAPTVNIYGNMYALELWHGPTCAFKDMALQIMPQLFTASLSKTNEKRTAYILVATSGDTGKAALEGYRDVDGVEICVFYPEDGVSRVQKLQMMTQEGKNVSVYAIKGNFDDAQNGVKRIFSDADVSEKLNRNGYFLSSANSINWGRLAPQIAYYVSAYCDLVNADKIKIGDKINVAVPTGNFGNILAAYTARRMGLPIDRLICASNRNNVLTDFIENGCYDRNREFFTTMSPSMDILISSNLERLLYYITDAKTTSDYMKGLAADGKYDISSNDTATALIKEAFRGYYLNEAETASVIGRIYDKHAYLSDTHTAVAIGCAERYISESGDDKPLVVCSTASPFKFAADVYRAVTGTDASGSVAALSELSVYTGKPIPQPLARTLTLPVRFNSVINVGDMESKLPF